MIDKLSDIPNEIILNRLTAIQKAIGNNISPDDIGFSVKNPDTYYYQVNSKPTGKIYLNKYPPPPENIEKRTVPLEIQVSADDLDGNFHLFKNIKKSVYWYFDENVELYWQFTVIQEKLNESAPGASCLQIVGYLDQFNNLEKITYMYYGNIRSESVVIEKTGNMLLSIEDETLIARYRYQKFMQLDAFNQMFDDIEGPPQHPLSLKEIENRLDVLEAIKY